MKAGSRLLLQRAHVTVNSSLRRRALGLATKAMNKGFSISRDKPGSGVMMSPMAQTVVSRDSDRDFTLACKGFTAEEFYAIYDAVAKGTGKASSRRPAIRNPVEPFGIKAINEILVSVATSGTALYVGKKLFDKVMDIVGKLVEEKVLTTKPRQTKTITVYAPNGRALYQVTYKEKKPKKLK